MLFAALAVTRFSSTHALGPLHGGGALRECDRPCGIGTCKDWAAEYAWPCSRLGSILMCDCGTCCYSPPTAIPKVEKQSLLPSRPMVTTMAPAITTTSTRTSRARFGVTTAPAPRRRAPPAASPRPMPVDLGSRSSGQPRAPTPVSAAAIQTVPVPARPQYDQRYTQQ